MKKLVSAFLVASTLFGCSSYKKFDKNILVNKNSNFIEKVETFDELCINSLEEILNSDLFDNDFKIQLLKKSNFYCDEKYDIKRIGVYNYITDNIIIKNTSDDLLILPNKKNLQRIMLHEIAHFHWFNNLNSNEKKEFKIQIEDLLIEYNNYEDLLSKKNCEYLPDQWMNLYFSSIINEKNCKPIQIPNWFYNFKEYISYSKDYKTDYSIFYNNLFFGTEAYSYLIERVFQNYFEAKKMMEIIGDDFNLKDKYIQNLNDYIFKEIPEKLKPFYSDFINKKIIDAEVFNNGKSY